MTPGNLVLRCGIELNFDRIEENERSTFWEKKADLCDDTIKIVAHKFKGPRSTLFILNLVVFDQASRPVRVTGKSWEEAERLFIALVEKTGLSEYLTGCVYLSQGKGKKQ